MNVVRTIGLNKVGKPARATDAGDGGDFLLPKLSLFNEFEIKGEDGKVPAAWAPRRMVGDNFLFRQSLAFRRCWRRSSAAGRVAGSGDPIAGTLMG